MSQNNEVKTVAEGTFELLLKNPVEYNGAKYDKLSFDFEKLTGKDAENIEDELNALGKSAPIPAYSADYLVRMAAKACDAPIGADIFRELSLKDREKVKRAARDFLLM